MQVTNPRTPDPTPEPTGHSPAAAARRAQIVASAIECIAELGYARASFAQIARHAGISSTRLISYHFAGKEDLMRAVVEEALRSAEAFMRPRLDAEASLSAKLAAYITSNLDFMGAHPAHIRAIVEIAANARAEDGAPAVEAAGPPARLGLLVHAFEQGQRAGEFRSFDPYVMAVSLRAAIDAVAGELAADPGLDLGRYARELVAIFDLATRRVPS